MLLQLLQVTLQGLRAGLGVVQATFERRGRVEKARDGNGSGVRLERNETTSEAYLPVW